eukprot:Awhi_evm1s2153
MIKKKKIVKTIAKRKSPRSKGSIIKDFLASSKGPLLPGSVVDSSRDKNRCNKGNASENLGKNINTLLPLSPSTLTSVNVESKSLRNTADGEEQNTFCNILKESNNNSKPSDRSPKFTPSKNYQASKKSHRTSNTQILENLSCETTTSFNPESTISEKNELDNMLNFIHLTKPAKLTARRRVATRTLTKKEILENSSPPTKNFHPSTLDLFCNKKIVSNHLKSTHESTKAVKRSKKSRKCEAPASAQREKSNACDETSTCVSDTINRIKTTTAATTTSTTTASVNSLTTTPGGTTSSESPFSIDIVSTTSSALVSPDVYTECWSVINFLDTFLSLDVSSRNHVDLWNLVNLYLE